MNHLTAKEPLSPWGTKKPWYFFFKNGMPIATRLADSGDEAIESFILRKKKTWEDFRNEGVTMRREEDVPSEEWNVIWEEYKKLEADREEREYREWKPTKELLDKHGTSRTKTYVHDRSKLQTSKYFPADRFH